MSGHAELEYRRAAEVIKSMITAERIRVGTFVTVPEIEKVAGATYSTARVAAKQLVTEGILQAHPGKGYAVVAMPEEAAARRADARELGQQVARLRDEVHALSARLDTSGDFGEKLERVESNLEDLFDKLGFEYATGGTGEPPAARHGRTG